ncbi:MAG: UbiA family prenyltransferase, partial [Candidatus Thermoplasmatota archaeon]|nr:UbiA family prenyltransferase [Candidatus Thermoplasmatota archaeon]
MGLKEILEFVKIEHTLFSLPFVFIGAELAGDPSLAQLAWILVAAIGARGLAMALNRIIDRKIDAENPRTSGRHLASGTMRLSTA